MADSTELRAEVARPELAPQEPRPALQVSALGKRVPLPSGELTILQDVGFRIDAWRHGGHRRRLRLGQEHPAVVAGRAGQSQRRPRDAGWRGAFHPGRGRPRAGARREGRLRLPELPAAALADRAGERDAAAGAARRRAMRRRRRGQILARGGAGRAPGPLPAPALGRRAAARGAGARVRHPARRCCSPTSPPATSTPPPARPSSSCCST